MKSKFLRTLVFGLLMVIGLSACDVPVIHRINPSRALAGQEIELIGRNFGDTAARVQFVHKNNEVEADEILSWDETSVRLIVPLELDPAQYLVILTRDDDVRSNNKAFTVIEAVPQATSLLVADRTQQRLFIYELDANGAATQSTSLPLGLPQYETRVLAIAPLNEENKFYVSVERRHLSGGDDRSELLVFSGSTQSVTQATRIDVGIQPRGLALSPNKRHLYVAATASGMLSVVDTATDTVIEDLSVDLSATSFGFEPLNLTVASAADASQGSHLVAIAGNNFFQGGAEIITYAPDASAETAIALQLPIPDTTLTGAMAVSAATGKIWLTGQREGLPTVALVDLHDGRIEEQLDIGPLGIQVPGFAEGITTAAGIFAAPGHAALFVALPQAGLARLTMAAPGDGLMQGTPELIDMPGVESLSPFHSGDGSLDSILALKPTAGSVDRIFFDGSVTNNFIERSGEISAVRQWSPLELLE